jgi:hypothetical protein
MRRPLRRHLHSIAEGKAIMQPTGFAHWLVVLVETGVAFALLLLALIVLLVLVTWVVDRKQTTNAVLHMLR